MNMNLIKSGIQLVSGFGVGLIADEALKVVKPRNLTGFKKVAVKVGGLVLSTMIADKASDYVGETIDKTVNEFKEFKKQKEVVTDDKEVEAE